MHLTLIPLLALLSTTGVSAVPWRDHEHRCDAGNTTVTLTRTVTTTATTTIVPSSSSHATSAAASSASVSASKSSSSSHASSVSVSASKSASSASASKTMSASTSISKSSAPSSVSKSISASASSASASKVESTSITSKAPSSSSTSKSTSKSASASSTSSAPVASTSTTSTDPNAQTYLDLHNNFRAHYQANAVSWNHTLSVYAQNAANTCVFKHTGGPYGENLAAGVGGGYNITSGFNSWANEASEYDPSNPQYSHFTQVVWKSTTQIGCATASCADGTIFTGYNANSLYIVCEYYPPGNVIGQFAQNVGTYQA